MKLEVLGDVKVEPREIKVEPLQSADNIVEITLDDIYVETRNCLKENHILDSSRNQKVNKDTLITNEQSDDESAKNDLGDSLCNVEIKVMENMVQSNFKNNKNPNEKEILLMNFEDFKNKPWNIKDVPLSRILDHEFIEKGSRNFVCSYCKHVFARKKTVKAHIRFQHREVVRMNQCPHCPFQTKYELNKHLICVHSDPDQINWFVCSLCDFKAKLKSQLKAHILYKHTDPVNCWNEMKKCSQCPKRFKSNNRMNRHITFVHNKGSLENIKCGFCSYEARTVYQVRNHTLVTHEDWTEEQDWLKCDKCDYKTKIKQRLYLHRNQRHGNNVQCHLCAYQGKSEQALKLHLIHHQTVKNEDDLKYKCTKCDYRTYRHYSLTVHQLKHKKPNEIEYFHCYHCSFKSNRKDNLKSHIQRHSKLNNVAWSCYICDFNTKSKHFLIDHIDKHARDQAKKL